jgi:hypothetical protein
MPFGFGIKDNEASIHSLDDDDSQEVKKINEMSLRANHTAAMQNIIFTTNHLMSCCYNHYIQMNNHSTKLRETL